MTESKNALAELAENLEHDNFFGCDHYKREVWVGKAQRIVAELAKVEDWTNDFGADEPRPYSSVSAIKKCRAIAEEGDAK